MTAPDDRLTEAGNALVAAIGKPMDSPEAVAVLDAIQQWIGEQLAPEGDGMHSVEGGVEVGQIGDTLSSVFLQLVPAERLRNFVHLDKLVRGVTAASSKAEVRALAGLPAINEYGLDKYLVGDGCMLYFKYAMRGANHLQYVGFTTLEDSQRRRLERAARKAAMPGQEPIEIADEDGILGLIDAAGWRSVLEDWNFDTLTQRFVDEMNVGRGVVWRAGSDGYGAWTIDVREKPSRKKAIREASHYVEVTAGKLSLVTYGQLTMAADEPEMSLASETEDQTIPLEPGAYQLLIRQLKNDVFEVVASKVDIGGVEPVTEPIWWSE